MKNTASGRFEATTRGKALRQGENWNVLAQFVLELRPGGASPTAAAIAADITQDLKLL